MSLHPAMLVQIDASVVSMSSSVNEVLGAGENEAVALSKGWIQLDRSLSLFIELRKVEQDEVMLAGIRVEFWDNTCQRSVRERSCYAMSEVKTYLCTGDRDSREAQHEVLHRASFVRSLMERPADSETRWDPVVRCSGR